MFLESLLFLVILIFLAYKYSSSTFNAWDKLGVVHLKPVPLFGNLPIIAKESFIEYMRKLYFQFPEDDYFGFWIMRQPVLVVRSPELIRRILVKDFDHFCDRVASSGSHDPWGKYNLFSSNQPIWGELRKRFTPAFTSVKLKTYQTIMKEKSECLVKHIATDTKVDILNLSSRYATDVVAATSFGIDANTLDNPASRLRRATQFMTNTHPIRRRVEMMVSFFAPKLSSLFKTYFFTKESGEYFTQLFNIAEMEREVTPSNENAAYLLDGISKSKGEVMGNGQVLTEDIIAAQGLIFLFAAIESSGTMLTLTLLELALRPDVQKRAFDEMNTVIKANGGVIDYQAVQQLQYLEQCVKETLRKYPIIAILDRICTKDYQIDANLELPKGTPVMINIAGLHHDPNYFPNPLLWDPERFAPENEIIPYTFLPLGEGPRTCIGGRFGMVSLKTAIAHIIYEYEIKSDPRTPHPNDLKYSMNDVFPHPTSPIHVQFIKRK